MTENNRYNGCNKIYDTNTNSNTNECNSNVINMIWSMLIVFRSNAKLWGGGGEGGGRGAGKILLQLIWGKQL